ncbi:restriction endonuclease subunit S [Paenibacillus sp. MWE-103]|uniref:Restriction endonuclease subunit S n=1 Tax=Paenibacillus artemisiicola TaxID=1172618 RepID=A0ABS3W8W7_9BACL|nr:restriction endonuclease subunit S [Paenibacillus artemisiicola]MBO7744756.1 restriction endonuclease subunit S [Paenibacillus artemisiicola]
MSRESAYAKMLDASAKVQLNVAMILEAKALEAEKVRSWMINHVTPDAFGDQQEHLKAALQIHEQLVEVIDGLTKLNMGMTNVLKAALRHEVDAEGGFEGMLGGGSFDMGDKE